MEDSEEIKKLCIIYSTLRAKTEKFRENEACEIDTVVSNYFSSVRATNVHVSGVLLQEKFLKVRSYNVSEHQMVG